MIEMRLHGRGGQGAVLAGNILAAALSREGRHVVAIPSFGFERRGAPVASFLRFDEREIRQFTNIYAPDCVLCIDPTVGRAVNIFVGVKPASTWVQCTSKPLAALDFPEAIARVGLCDAVAISSDIFGRTITNTIMLGALAKTTGYVSLDALRSVIEDSEFRDAGLQQNLDGLARGYEETVVHQIERRVAA